MHLNGIPGPRALGILANLEQRQDTRAKRRRVGPQGASSFTYFEKRSLLNRSTGSGWETDPFGKIRPFWKTGCPGAALVLQGGSVRELAP